MRCSSSKCTKTCFRPGLRPGLRWGAYDAILPVPHSRRPRRRLRRLPSSQFAVTVGCGRFSFCKFSTSNRLLLQLRCAGISSIDLVWLGGVVVSALGMRTRRPRFESRVATLFNWVATLGKLFTHCLPSFSAPRNWGYKREFLAPKWLW